jgi:AraC family transcriptional regulator
LFDDEGVIHEVHPMSLSGALAVDLTESEIAHPQIAQAVSLLEFAQAALPRDVSLADRYLTDATALLRAGCKRPSLDFHSRRGGTLAAWQIGRVERLVRSHLSRSIRMDELAAATGLSRSYFSYAFRRTVGEPPFCYLRRCRVELAQQLIRQTDKSLAEIALECGLADQSHLTRCFRAFVGMSPGTWRRLHGPSESIAV